MAEPGVSRLMASLLSDLGPLMSFLTESKWAQRLGDPDVCDFVAGNPHDPPLPALVKALKDATEPRNKDWFAYKLNEQPARETAAAALRAQQGIAFEPEDVFLTPGTFGGLSVALRALVDPGDEVIFISPPWFFYEPMIRAAGATPVRVTSSPPFDVPVEGVRDAITPRTRAVIVNTPNNPTGRIVGREALDELATVLADASARAGRPVLLFSDESYSRILFDGHAFVPPAASYPDTVVLYTYGKTLLAPSARIGLVALPPAMEGREALRAAIQLAQVIGGWQFPNAVEQHALPDIDPLSIDIPRLQRRRDRLVGELRGMGYELHVPEATFYLLPRSPLPDDGAFVSLLGDQDVFVLPGWAFELPGYFRISVTANDDMVERSLPGFAAAIKSARGA
jgi:aspartate aminotransferase